MSFLTTNKFQEHQTPSNECLLLLPLSPPITNSMESETEPLLPFKNSMRQAPTSKMVMKKCAAVDFITKELELKNNSPLPNEYGINDVDEVVVNIG